MYTYAYEKYINKKKNNIYNAFVFPSASFAEN